MEGCDVGGGGNDIKSIAASFDAGLELVDVRLELCDEPETNAKYSVHFDFCNRGLGGKACSSIGPDTANNEKCSTTADATMKRHMKRNGARDSGPGVIELGDPTMLLFSVGMEELDPRLIRGDRLLIWAESRLKNVTDGAPNTEGGDRCDKPQSESETVALELFPTDVDCPCGDPLDFVPFQSWGAAVCNAPPNSSRTSVVSSLIPLHIYSRQDAEPFECVYTDQSLNPISEAIDISSEQEEACAALIVNYAQMLKDAGVFVSDNGCNLR